MKRRPISLAAAAATAIVVVMAIMAARAVGTSILRPSPGRIHGVLVTSDKVEDLSSLEAIVAHAENAPSERDKAEELFRLAVKFRHQAEPANEFVEGDHVHDPVKIFNVYGYCACCCATAAMMALGREAGFETRGRNLKDHTVPELFYDHTWHMFDASLINYFVTDRGHVAGVDDLLTKRGTDIDRAHCDFLGADDYLPARTHDLDDLEDLYSVARSTEHEQLYSVGHRMGQSLRAGEILRRSWANREHYLDEDAPGRWPPTLSGRGRAGSLAYLERFDPDYTMGLIGNGVLRYKPDLASGAWRDGLLSERNVAGIGEDARSPALHLRRSGDGELVIPMSSSYVFLSGALGGRFVKGGSEDTIGADISLNDGLDWIPIWEAQDTGAQEVNIDLTAHVRRRYRYLLRIRISGKAASSGVESLVLHHSIQHAQRALPRLGPGDNLITVTSPDPALATITREGSFGPRAGGLSHADFHPGVSGLKELPEFRALFLSGGERGTLTFPVETPGDVAAVRFGGSFRSLDPIGSIRLLVSDDEGESWKEAKTIPGPFVGYSRYVRFTDVAPGTRRVLVRYELNGREQLGVGIFVFRVDVDYHDPLAGPRPVKVTYDWREGGAGARKDERIIDRYPTTYTIRVEGNPIMKALTIEGL